MFKFKTPDDEKRTTRAKLVKVISSLDSFPLMPAHLAGTAMDRFFAQRSALVSARLGKGVHKPDGSLTTDSLGEVIERLSLGREELADPQWLATAQKIRNWTLKAGFLAVERRTQRAKNGWAADDTWDAGRYLARVTAGMLEHLVTNSYGWPGTDEFPEFEDWTAALAENAAKLRAFSARDDGVELAQWHRLLTAGAPQAEIDAAFDAIQVAETAAMACGEEAMNWVAAHLADLWD